MREDTMSITGLHPGSDADLDWFPFGMAVADLDGKLLICNQAARKLLGHAGASTARNELDTCCDLICSRIEGDGVVCLTTMAADHSGPLPEIRIDIRREREQAHAAWVGTKATADGSAVAFQIRPGALGDRRRRTRPYWLRGKQLRVRALGTTTIDAGETTLGGDWLGHRPGQIFKYLLCRRPDVVQSDEIIEALGMGGDSTSAPSIRPYVHALRNSLEPERRPRQPSAFVLAQQGGYLLSSERLWVDADEFQDLVTAGVSARRKGEDELALSQFQRAAEIYGGDFLVDERYSEWALEERERLRNLAGTAFNAIIELHSGGDPDGEADAAHKLADLDPYDSRAQRRFIGLCISQGRRTEATRRYEAFRHRLLRDFGEAPDFTLADLIAGAGDRVAAGTTNGAR